VANVTVLDKTKGQAWTREEAHLVVDQLGCHVERWAKMSHRMVAHVDEVTKLPATKSLFARVLGHDDFAARVVAADNMWKED